MVSVLSEKLADFRCELIGKWSDAFEKEKTRMFELLGVATGEGNEDVDDENEEEEEQMLLMSKLASRRLSSASFRTQSSASRIVVAIKRKVRLEAKSVNSKLPPVVFASLARLTGITHRGLLLGEKAISPRNDKYFYKGKLNVYFEIISFPRKTIK